MLPGSTVYVVDDDMTVRILLEEVFHSVHLNVETYASGEEFLEAYSPANLGCLLLDILMPGMSGIELQEKLTERGNRTPVIFLSGVKEVGTAVKALKGGAVDFIEKPVQPQTVVQSVSKAIEMDLRNRFDHLHDSQIEQRIALLTPREDEVMNWVVKGKSNKEIARILGISARTVEVHRRNVFSKMQAGSLADLVQMALRVRTI